MEPVEINVAYHSAREVSIDETRVSAKREQAAARGDGAFLKINRVSQVSPTKSLCQNESNLTGRPETGERPKHIRTIEQP